LGIEVAKNLILAGPKQVTLYDETICEIGDLGCNFYIKEEYVGKKTRADACVKYLRELNQNVHVESTHKHGIA
jgi:molybdopterin/thiamine biosynthesis adenylyltransferase